MNALLWPGHPNLLRSDCLINEEGRTLAGTITNIEWEEIDGSLHFTFEYDLEEDIAAVDAAVFVLRNGRYLTRFAATETVWVFIPVPNSVLEAFEFFLAPNEDIYRNMLDYPRITNSVRLTWVFNATTFATNDTKKLRIKYCSGAGTPTTTLTDLTRIGAQRNGENGSASNSSMYASGKWEDPDILYTTIHIEITTPGYSDGAFPDQAEHAEYAWTWGTFTGVKKCYSWPDHIINGIKVNFEKDAPYAIGDEWDIIVSLPTEWESNGFAVGGACTFGVNSINSAGDEATGPTKLLNIYIPPDAPTITGTPIHADFSGSIEITWTAPDSAPSPLAYYRVYTNRPHLDIRQVDWCWEYSGTIAAGESFTVTVSGLEEGFNRVCATVVDELGNESDLSIPWEITLNGSLNELGAVPNMPDSIKAEMISTGDILVTVYADDTSDTIYLYHDNTTGTIDYTTVVAQITNPRAGYFQKLQATLTDGLVDGIYRIAARASRAGADEDNTDLWCSVLRDKDTPALVSGLSGSVVYA